MKVHSIQPTPNPNAFKFLTDTPLAPPGQTRSLSGAQEAPEDSLVQALFAIDGVDTLFFCENFVTVSMRPDADWRGVAESVTRQLESHEGGVSGGGPAPTETGDSPLDTLPKGGDPELLRQINAVLDDRVRPALAGDGGGLEILGLDGKTLVIRYQGACGTCPSAIQGTLMAIQNLLQSEVDEELVVSSA